MESIPTENFATLFFKIVINILEHFIVNFFYEKLFSFLMKLRKVSLVHQARLIYEVRFN